VERLRKVSLGFCGRRVGALICVVALWLHAPLAAASGCCKINEKNARQNAMAPHVVSAIASDCRSRPEFSCRGDCEWKAQDCDRTPGSIAPTVQIKR
jgi:hypothetical protein